MFENSDDEDDDEIDNINDKPIDFRRMVEIMNVFCRESDNMAKLSFLFKMYAFDSTSHISQEELF